MKLGIIGGLGPLASVRFYELLTKMTRAKKDQDHLHIILNSFPQIPDRTAYILDTTQENPLPLLIEAAKDLEKMNVDYLTIPCNTAHYFYQNIEKEIHIPFINIVDEVIKDIKRRNIRKVGLMATDGTLKCHIYQQAFNKENIEVIIPDQENQKKIMTIIYDQIKAGITIDQELFDQVSQFLFDQGVETIILGCTELSLAKKDLNLSKEYTDSLEVLAKTCLNKCQVAIKEEN